MNKTGTTQETWINSKWRPAMGWAYMGICIFDFFVAPILWSILQATQKGNVTEPWTPLTLQGAGLFHLSMGAILGITAWSRGKEKMTEFENRRTYSQPATQTRYDEYDDTNDGNQDAADHRDRLTRDTARENRP
jgi:hypothetical protein